MNVIGVLSNSELVSIELLDDNRYDVVRNDGHISINLMHNVTLENGLSAIRVIIDNDQTLTVNTHLYLSQIS